MSGVTSPSKNKLRRLLPNVPNRRGCNENSPGRVLARSKSVTFNTETVETSIGGTESYGHIQNDTLSPCNGGDFLFKQPTEIPSFNCADSEMKDVSNLDQSKTVDCESSDPLNKQTECNSNSEKPDQENMPECDPSLKSSTPVIRRPLSKDSAEDLINRRLRNLPRSKTLSSGVKLDVLPDMASPVTKQSNLLNLHPMGDSPTKIPVPARRTTQSYPDGQSPAPITRDDHETDSVCAKIRDTTPLKPISLSRSSLLSPNAMTNGTPVRRHTLDKLPPTPECYNHVLFEPGRLSHGISNDSLMEIEEMSESEDLEGSCSVTVAVRVRPFSQRELSDQNVRCVVGMGGNQTTITSDSGQNHKFNYDFSFWSFDDEHGDFAGQEYVYNSLARPLLGKAFEGYNTCLFAYGQTGSGKSYSIMGHGRDVGIIPRFSEELFCRMEEQTTLEQPVKMNVEISFFEIYNEKIHDLLASSKEKTGKKALKVREHPVLGPYVEGLSTFVVNSFEDIQGWITLGNKSRATAATGMNDKSSRSHSVFTLVLTQTRSEMLEGQNHDHSTTSKINLVDLAGSERQSQAQTSGERLREGANINKSLMTLGKVISLLSDRSLYKKKKIFIPYRDSVLTWLLKESLGGNSKTAMLATISPANHHTEETLSTLRYAKQARSIVNNVRVNEDPKARLIRELRAEIDKLRSQTGSSNDMNEVIPASGLAEIASLKERLLMKEKEVEEASRSWKEKLQRSVASKEQELKALEKAGVSFKVDNKLPNLVNLNEDAQLSEMLLYILKEGQTKVGRLMDKSCHDIQLNGALIADDHCVIHNASDRITLTPNKEAPTYVNGNLVTDPIVLHHGDRVILGGDHYFRFNHPIERQKKNHTAGTEIKDFEFAKQELLRVQESRLQAELEEAKRLAQEEMTAELEKIKKEAEVEFKAQKSGYEGKLANLESSLKTQKEKAEEAQKEATQLISKLQKQKMLLEQEVLAGKRRHHVELQTSQKVHCEVNWKRSKLLDLLESEKEKMSKKLEEAKQRRNEIPSPSKKLKVATIETGKTDLYRNALLLSEANRIGQHLKKNTIFSRQDDLENEEMKTFIKVTNSKLNICTYWSLAKFEEKLLSMRELYQGEGDNSTVDEVFYDPTDSWEKENGFNSPRNSRGSRLSSSNRRCSLLGTPLLNSTRRSSYGSHRADSITDMNRVSSFASVTRSMLKLTIDRLKEEVCPDRSIADEMLISADSLKLAISVVIDSPIVSKDSSLDTDCVPRNLLQMMNSYQVLASLASLWSSLYRAVDSPLIHDLTEKITDLVKELGNHMGLFLQGCENEIDTMIEESGFKILTTLFALCRNCGELALATDTPMTTLMTPEEGSCNDSDSNSTIALGSDVRQAFLGGCDVFVDKTLKGGIKSLEECEFKVQTQAEQVMTTSAALGVIPIHVEVVMASSRVLLEKCQEIQAEVDSSMMENSDVKPAQFYHHSYSRSQRLVTNVSCFIDTINLLIQATDSIIQGSDTDLRKITRCAEMIQKAAHKLFIVSKGDPVIGRLPSSSSQSEALDTSVLSDSQLGQLSVFVQDVKFDASSLIEKVEKLTETDWASLTPNRGKRTLPASPDRVTPVPLVQNRNRSLWRSAERVQQQHGTSRSTY